MERPTKAQRARIQKKFKGWTETDFIYALLLDKEMLETRTKNLETNGVARSSGRPPGAKNRKKKLTPRVKKEDNSDE